MCAKPYTYLAILMVMIKDSLQDVLLSFNHINESSFFSCHFEIEIRKQVSKWR